MGVSLADYPVVFIPAGLAVALVLGMRLGKWEENEIDDWRVHTTAFALLVVFLFSEGGVMHLLNNLQEQGRENPFWPYVVYGVLFVVASFWGRIWGAVREEARIAERKREQEARIAERKREQFRAEVQELEEATALGRPDVEVVAKLLASMVERLKARAKEKSVQPNEELNSSRGALQKAASVVEQFVDNLSIDTERELALALQNIETALTLDPPTQAQLLSLLDATVVGRSLRAQSAQQVGGSAASKPVVVLHELEKLVEQLLKACEQGNVSMVAEHVSEIGANQSSHGETLLMRASRSGQLEVVRLLLRHGAARGIDDKYDEYGHTALIYAARAGHLEVVELLLACGASVNLTGQYRDTALIGAAQGHPAVVELLVRKGAAVNLVDNVKRTALMWAAEKGVQRAVECLVSNGADLNLKCGQGKTALMYAAKAGHAKIVELLLRSGANANEIAACGETAMILAGGNGHHAVGQLLMRHGAEFTLEDSLLVACERGDLAEATKAIKMGAKLDTVRERGRVPLIAALYRDHADVARLLIDQGADVNASDGTHTALGWAKARKLDDIAQLLSSMGAKND